MFGGCKLSSNAITCSCKKASRDSDFPDLMFTHGNDGGTITFSLKGSQYMEATTDTSCTSIFQTSSTFDSANYWLMGLPIYRAFDIIHDSAEMKIGFKP